MNPFVVAGEVARIEGRPQAAARERLCNGRKHGFPGDADVRGLVPGDKAVEIGGCGLEERLIMVRDQSGAGGKAAPIANSNRDAVASICDPAARRAQADHGLTRVAGRKHDMGGKDLAGIAHRARRLHFAQAEPRSGQDAPDGGGGARGAPFVQSDLIDVDRRAQSGRRMHEHGRRVLQRLGPARNPAQHRYEIVGNEQARRAVIPFRRLEIFPAHEPDRLAAAHARFSQDGRKIGLERAILTHEAHALRERNVEAGKPGQGRVGFALVADHEHTPISADRAAAAPPRIEDRSLRGRRYWRGVRGRRRRPANRSRRAHRPRGSASHKSLRECEATSSGSPKAGTSMSRSALGMELPSLGSFRRPAATLLSSDSP